MKISILRKSVITFGLGAFFGIALVASYSFISNSASSDVTGNIQTIDNAKAQQLTSRYRESAEQFNDVLNGFSVNTDQLEAMNRLNSEIGELTGFRLYLGKDQSGAEISVVYGVDQNGRDAKASAIYSTGLSHSGPCPPVCD